MSFEPPENWPVPQELYSTEILQRSHHEAEIGAACDGLVYYVSARAAMVHAIHCAAVVVIDRWAGERAST
jgi:hypothetical protein